MDDKYLDQFGRDEKYVSRDNSKRHFVPLVMGIINVVIFVVYLSSAFGDRGLAMCFIYFVPFLSIIGLIFSVVTRRSRDEYFTIWICGLILCALSLVIYFFVFVGTMFALAQH